MAINLGTIFAQIGLDTSLLRAGVKKANAQLAKSDRSIGAFVKRNEGRFLKFGAVGAAAVGAIGIASIKMAGDFDQAMRNVNTITQLSEEQFDEMKEAVIDLSREVPLTARELSDGLFNVASAGVDAANQMNFLTVSSKAATAGQADLSTTVKGLTGVLKGYGDEFSNVDKIADLFFKTNELGVTTFEELADGMGKVVPIAAALGVTQEELFASMATLTGVTGNTSEVVTQLKAAFTNLIKPSKEAQEIAEELGISFDATSIEALGLAGFLEQIQVATGGNVETMGKLFGSVEGLNAILALTGSSSEKFNENLLAMADSAGAATDAFSEQQKGLNNQLKVLKNNVSAIALDIGGTMLPKLTEFTTRINALDQGTKDNLASFAEWSLAIVGSVSVIALLTGGISKLIGAFTGLAGPIGAAVAITAAHFIITQKIANLFDNQWIKSIIKSMSLIGSFVEAINSWNLAVRTAENENISLIRALFRVRTTIEDDTVATDDLTDSLNALGAVEAEPTVTVDTSQAERNIASVISLIDRVQSKTVTIRAIQISQMRPFEKGGTVRGFETGGAIRGYQGGGGTSERTVLVGERGPELARLPMGTRISANNNLGQALRDNQEGQEIVVPVTVLLNDDVIFESVERSGNREEFRRIQ